MPAAISQPPHAGGYVNLPAIVLVVMCMALLIRGGRESTTFNAILVLIKLGVLAFFVVIALSAFSVKNLQPFTPKGWSGVGSAASTIFFSYIGIDAISTAGEDGILWISYPKLASTSAFDLSRQVVWDSLTGTGWEPVTQVAVDETWSALRIRPTEKVGTRRR